LARLRAVKPPARDVIGQGAVIEDRIVSPQRQLKTVLAFLSPVAGAGVAADFAHRGQNLPREIHRFRLKGFYGHRNAGFQFAEPGDQFRLAGCFRRDETVPVQLGIRPGERERRFLRQIIGQAVFRKAGDDHPANVPLGG
jgi:hypothetical protein